MDNILVDTPSSKNTKEVGFSLVNICIKKIIKIDEM